MDILETKHGILEGVANYMNYEDGQVKSCIVKTENRLSTPVGELIPLYKSGDYGERQKKHRSSLTFFPNGELKSAALNDQMPIESPIGKIEAELVTFYEDGSINRLFPLNGKIDGYWSEQNEGEMAPILDFKLPIGHFSAKIIGLHFYPSGILKSLTLWPGQRIEIETPLGPMKIRNGFSLYEDGSLKSIEPGSPTLLNTPIGPIIAYDPDPIGVHADENSIIFTKEGDLLSLKSVDTGILVQMPNGLEGRFEPYETPSMIEMDETVIAPITVYFAQSEIVISDKQERRFDLKSHTFSVFKKNCITISSCGGGSCSSCSGCG